MAQDYNEYLAAVVLSERQFVSYRQLSRALKIHSNLAKQMLYEFHRKQTAKRPGSVHATYLLTGTRRPATTPRSSAIAKANGQSQGDAEDTLMQSSPPLPSSSLPQDDGSVNHEADDHDSVPIRSVVLVKEENLDQARQDFLSISSIHIYSLESSPLNDLHVLTECNRKVAAEHASEDPLEAWKQYGTIQNPEVRRRERKGGAAAAPPISVRAPEVSTKVNSISAKEKDHERVKSDESKVVTANKGNQEAKPASKPPPATAKRQGSDIFKSFAKTQSKPKAAPAEPAPKAEQPDEPMGGFSDDDEDDDAPAVDQDEAKVPEGKSKKEREAELQAMMEQEDEKMEDAEAPTAEPEEPEVTIDTAASEQTGDQKETVTVENGRRRGRRRVMKKKTVKDEEGFLVTKEEPAWESFSEDEPAPKKIKVSPTTTMNGAGKTAKKGSKPGQGNIMSFFSKK